MGLELELEWEGLSDVVVGVVLGWNLVVEVSIVCVDVVDAWLHEERESVRLGIRSRLY